MNRAGVSTPLAAVKLREKVYAPLKILTIVQALSECGVAAEASLAGTGLSIEEVRDPDARTSVHQLLTVGRNAVRLSPSPELGLSVGRRLHVTSYGLYGYAMLSAETMRQGFDRAPHMANPITAAQMSESCERLVQQLAWQSGLTRRVYEEITRTPGRFPSIEHVASSLCMTSRTLSRKLAAEGMTFSDLLARVRHALALDYLRTTRLSMEDIAEALGFSDANSFRQAFRRWSGKSPTEFRP